MSYSDFRLDTVCKSFQLSLQRTPLFPVIETVPVTPWLQETLVKGMPLAFGSEKARSEFIVAPILLASRELSKEQVHIYSGERLDVDTSRGLTGECDFILARTPPVPVLQAPIFTIVEAKKGDVEAGLGQCTAQMVGATIFNQREGSDIDIVFGCVTTGEDWQFLKLGQSVLTIDSNRYYINDVEAILGVFQAIFACYT